MKNACKRMIALILAMAMCLSLLSANVWATEEPEDGSVFAQSSEEATPAELSGSEEEAPEAVSEEAEAVSEAEEKEPEETALEAEERPKEEESTAEADASQEDQNEEKSEEDAAGELETQETYRGSYGSIYYSYDTYTGELTIWGTGPIQKRENEAFPWRTGSLYYCYESCIKLTIQEGVTAVQDNAFSGFTWLREINLPESLQTIGTGTFAYCKKLEELSLPETVTEIGKRAFYDCEGLKKATVPSSVQSIGEEAFELCEKLATLTLQGGLKSIGIKAFCDCDSLRQVQIPDTVTSIGEAALAYCDLLERVTLPSGLKKISNSLFCGDEKLWSAVIPESVESIGNNSFRDCGAIKELHLPEGLSEIGSCAFRCTGAKKLVIPASVTLIDEEALTGSDIETLVFEGSPPTMWTNSLSVGDDVSVYYPEALSDRWTETTRNSCGDYLIWYPFCHVENDEIITTHSFNGVVTKQPTYAQAGIKTFACTYCGLTKTEILPKLVKPPTPVTDCVVTLSRQYYTYNGKEMKPTVTVSYQGKVINSTNYTVTYSSNVNAGIAAVTVTGKNELTGSTTKKFTIAKAQQNISIELTNNSIYPGKTAYVICDGIGSLQYSSDNTRIATVNQEGKISGVAAGETTINVLASGNSNYESDMASVSITVLKPLPARKECEKLYAPVLDMFYYNIKTNWKNYPDIYSGLSDISSVYPMYRTSKSDGKQFGYCFKDINADGNPELIISTGGAKNNRVVDELYTCVNGQLYHLLSSEVRYQHYLLSDGTLLEESSGGASTTYYYHHQLKKNGKNLSFLEGVIIDYGKCYHVTKAKWDKHGRWTESKYDSITKKKLNNIKDSWGKEIKFHSSLDNKYKPKSKSAVYEAVTSSLPKTRLQTVKAGAAGSINVTWKKNAKGKGYWVRLSTDKIGLKNVKTVKVKGNGTVKKTIKGLKKGAWYVRICTVKGSTFSGWSGAKKVTVK